MNTDVLESVLAVNKYHSFQEAALSLSRSISSISKHVASVEEDLGVRLFTRGTKARSVMLSAEGAQLMPLMEDVISSYERLTSVAERMQKKTDRSINIAQSGLVSSMGEDDILSRFFLNYPKNNIRMHIEPYAEIERMLCSGAADCAFWLAEDAEQGQSGASNLTGIRKLKKSGMFEVIPYYKSAVMHVGLPENHPLAGRQSVSLEQLRELTFLFSSMGPNNGLSDTGHRLFQSSEPPLKIRFIDFVRRETVFDLVRSGQYALPTVGIVDETVAGIKWPVLEDWGATSRGMFVYRRDVKIPALANLCRCVEEYAANLPEQV